MPTEGRRWGPVYVRELIPGVCSYTRVHEPSAHTKSQASGRGGRKGGSPGAMQPLSHSPLATLVRRGWPSLAQDTAQPHLALLPEGTSHTQAPSPGSG